jgi:membrane protein
MTTPPAWEPPVHTIFSLAPLLLIVIAVAGLIFGADAARGEIVGQLRGLIGDAGAIAVQGLLKSASRPAASAIASLVSVGTLAFGATSIFSELQSDLDRIWRAPTTQGTTGLWVLVRSRLLTFGMILAIGFLLLVSLVFSAAMAAFGRWLGPAFASWELLATVVNFVISFALISVLFALIYKILPRVRVAWHDVWVGAAVTSLLFNIGKLAIGLHWARAALPRDSGRPDRSWSCSFGSITRRRSFFLGRNSPGSSPTATDRVPARRRLRPRRPCRHNRTQ